MGDWGNDLHSFRMLIWRGDLCAVYNVQKDRLHVQLYFLHTFFTHFLLISSGLLTLHFYPARN